MPRFASGIAVAVEPMHQQTAEQSVMIREQADALYDEIDRLPKSFRLAVMLCHLEGLTLDEAARRLRCPSGTVSSRLTRARERATPRSAAARVRLFRGGHRIGTRLASEPCRGFTDTVRDDSASCNELRHPSRRPRWIDFGLGDCAGRQRAAIDAACQVETVRVCHATGERSGLRRALRDLPALPNGTNQ